MMFSLSTDSDVTENARFREENSRATELICEILVLCDNDGLTISTKQTAVVHQLASGKSFSEPTITVNGQRM